MQRSGPFERPEAPSPVHVVWHEFAQSGVDGPCLEGFALEDLFDMERSRASADEKARWP
jgi:hypothetical protein